MKNEFGEVQSPVETEEQERGLEGSVVLGGSGGIVTVFEQIDAVEALGRDKEEDTSPESGGAQIYTLPSALPR